MVLIVSRENAAEVKRILAENGETVYDMGEVTADETKEVQILGAEKAWV